MRTLLFVIFCLVASALVISSTTTAMASTRGPTEVSIDTSVTLDEHQSSLRLTSGITATQFDLLSNDSTYAIRGAPIGIIATGATSTASGVINSSTGPPQYAMINGTANGAWMTTAIPSVSSVLGSSLPPWATIDTPAASNISQNNRKFYSTNLNYDNAAIMSRMKTSIPGLTDVFSPIDLPRGAKC